MLFYSKSFLGNSDELLFGMYDLRKGSRMSDGSLSMNEKFKTARIVRNGRCKLQLFISEFHIVITIFSYIKSIANLDLCKILMTLKKMKIVKAL